jgi:hypothetical protein
MYFQLFTMIPRGSTTIYNSNQIYLQPLTKHLNAFTIVYNLFTIIYKSPKIIHNWSTTLSISLWQIYDNVVNEGLSIVHIALGHLPRYCDKSASYQCSKKGSSVTRRQWELCCESAASRKCSFAIVSLFRQICVVAITPRFRRFRAIFFPPCLSGAFFWCVTGTVDPSPL